MILFLMLFHEKRHMNPLPPVQETLPARVHFLPDRTEYLMKFPKNAVERRVVGAQCPHFDAFFSLLKEKAGKLISLLSELLRPLEVSDLSYEKLCWLVRTVHN